MEENKETTMEKEKLEILNMVHDGKITPEEGLKLLNAIQLENVKFISDSTKRTKSSSTKIKIITNAGSSDSETRFEDLKELETILNKAESNGYGIKIDPDNNSSAKILSLEEIDEILQPIFEDVHAEVKSKKKAKKNSMPKKITIEKPDGSMEIIEL